LSLLRRGGSEVELGNLLSLPVAGGFLYVEPVYVRASQDGYPLLQRVLVSFGTEVAFERNLSDALAKVLGASVSDDPTPRTRTRTRTRRPPRAAAHEGARGRGRRLEGGQGGVCATGDFTAYGKAQDELRGRHQPGDRSAAADRPE
jgi:uncharacterized membrane protein (UPF0182 family)